MPEEESSPATNDALLERLDALEQVVREQIGRIYALERKLGQAPPATRDPHPFKSPDERGVPIAAPRATAPAPPFGVSQVKWREAQMTEARAEASPKPHPATEPSPPPANIVPAPSINASTASTKKPQDLETQIVGNWFNRIAIVAIILGVGFFLKYAFDNQWIGPRGKVMTGVLAGLALLVGGERLRARDYKQFAQGLSGGGIAILYLSVFAAFSFYQLVGQLPAFALMTMVTATAVLLAARYDALAIAILGLLGGFLTPILLSTGVDNQVGLFGYIALLDLGVLALAWFKRWRSLNYFAFGGTAFLFALWAIEWYQAEKLWTTLFFLTLFFVIFALLPVLHAIAQRGTTDYADISLTFTNAGLYFASAYGLLDDRHRVYLGLFAVVVSAFYLALGYFVFNRNRTDRRLILSLLGLAAIFLTLAVPIQLDQHWTTMGWALEGVVLTWLGLTTHTPAARRAGLLVFLIALGHWLAIDVAEFGLRMEENFTPLLNRRALSGLVLVASLAAVTWLYQKRGARVETQERNLISGGCLLAANAVALLLLSVDVNDFYERMKLPWLENQTAVMRLLTDIESSKQTSLTCLWSIYGWVLLAVGIRRHISLLRYAALTLLGLTAIKVLAIDSRYYVPKLGLVLSVQTWLSFWSIVGALGLGVWFYNRAKEITNKEHQFVLPALIIAANALAVVGLSLIASGYFKAAFAANTDPDALREVLLWQRLSLSLIWTVYGGALLVLGLVRRSGLLRWMGLTLLALVILKVFLFDLNLLDRFYRIVSFIALGVILLVVSFLYQQFQRKVAQE